MNKIGSLEEAVEVFKLMLVNLSYGDIHMSIVDESPIPYGTQLRVQYQDDFAIANVYYGKKGARFVYQGKDNKALALLNRFFPITK